VQYAIANADVRVQVPVPFSYRYKYEYRLLVCTVQDRKVKEDQNAFTVQVPALVPVHIYWYIYGTRT
jgi:hypothetical protein